MRVRGRKIWASTLAERRLLMSMGGMPLRVPRGVSPFVVARRLTRAAASEHPDVVFVRELLSRRRGAPCEVTDIERESERREMTDGNASVAA